MSNLTCFLFIYTVYIYSFRYIYIYIYKQYEYKRLERKCTIYRRLNLKTCFSDSFGERS